MVVVARVGVTGARAWNKAAGAEVMGRGVTLVGRQLLLRDILLRVGRLRLQILPLSFLPLPRTRLRLELLPSSPRLRLPLLRLWLMLLE